MGLLVYAAINHVSKRGPKSVVIVAAEIVIHLDVRPPAGMAWAMFSGISMILSNVSIATLVQNFKG